MIWQLASVRGDRLQGPSLWSEDSSSRNKSRRGCPSALFIDGEPSYRAQLCYRALGAYFSQTKTFFFMQPNYKIKPSLSLFFSLNIFPYILLIYSPKFKQAFVFFILYCNIKYKALFVLLLILITF